MPSRQEIVDLGVGDQVELAPIFPKLTTEPVVLKVAEKKGEKVLFDVTYYGIALGKYVAKIGEKGVEWGSH